MLLHQLVSTKLFLNHESALAASVPKEQVTNGKVFDRNWETWNEESSIIETRGPYPHEYKLAHMHIQSRKCCIKCAPAALVPWRLARQRRNFDRNQRPGTRRVEKRSISIQISTGSYSPRVISIQSAVSCITLSLEPADAALASWQPHPEPKDFAQTLPKTLIVVSNFEKEPLLEQSER